MERHTIRAVVTTGIVGELIGLIYVMRWLFIVMAILIIADLYFGISESRKRFFDTKDLSYKVRLSRAMRRTFNKSIDYLCYVLISAVIAKAFAEPCGVDMLPVASFMCLFIALWEMSSIIGHVCFLHDIPFKFSPKKFFIALVKSKNEDIGEALEDSTEDKK